MESFLQYPLYILVGFIATLSGGFWGLGGGWFIVPALIILGVGDSTAVAASLLQMLPSSSFTVFRQLPGLGWGRKQWGFAAALPLCTAIFIGGFFGRPAGIFIENLFDSRKPHQALYLILMLFIFWKIVFGGGKKHVSSEAGTGRALSRVPLTFMAGLFSGAISTLLGIGGGTVNRPVLRNFLRIPEDVAAKIARLAVFVTALSGTISYLYGSLCRPGANEAGLDFIPIGVFLTLGGIVGFSCGAWMHSKVVAAGNDESSHKSFALVVLMVAICLVFKITGTFELLRKLIIIFSGVGLVFYLIYLTLISMKKLSITGVEDTADGKGIDEDKS